MRFIAKQNLLMKIGNHGNLVLSPFDESTPCLMIVLMNCQTKQRINLLTAVKSVAILESNANLNFYTWKKTLFIWGNEEADALAKEGAREALATSNCLTYLELYFARKDIVKKTLLVHPVHT
ncbi:alpha-2 adrenergic receptor [Trichonephila clavipes]|nr:alpha-2 adrenergic receptor [Trichonephila clavipes]